MVRSFLNLDSCQSQWDCLTMNSKPFKNQSEIMYIIRMASTHITFYHSSTWTQKFGFTFLKTGAVGMKTTLVVKWRKILQLILSRKSDLISNASNLRKPERTSSFLVVLAWFLLCYLQKNGLECKYLVSYCREEPGLQVLKKLKFYEKFFFLLFKGILNCI